jgi:UDP-N-acetylmuramoyl-L-alanyl-D-glutamate--2,6-diaminopimelate ligase
MHLEQLLSVIPEVSVTRRSEVAEVVVSGLCIDSRQVRPGDCFLAFPGFSTDGRQFIEAAIKAGASAVLYEGKGASEMKLSIPSVAIDQLHTKLSLLAGFFFDHPGESLNIVGITGTNGKTSVSHFLAQAYQLLGKSSAVMGTLGVGPLGYLEKTGMTTPDAWIIQKNLAKLRDNSVQYLAMEVSSHALAQYRVASVPIQTAVYTQLSPDHLDFHRNMDDYAQCKEKLFQFRSLKNAVINADDPWGHQFIERYKDRYPIIAYAFKNAPLGVQSVICERYSSLCEKEAGYRLHLATPWGNGEVEIHLLGEYNIANVLAVVGVLGIQGFNWAQIKVVLPKLQPVEGRLQWFRHPSGTRFVVDFAHTPDALEQVLKTLRPLCSGLLHCVFGCGGNRDASKRPVMGRIAATHADRIWITNDNPRNEEPQVIAQSIREGCRDHPRVVIELDRKKAITSALTAAGKHDMILVAGKGHETEQIIGEDTLVFSDIDCVLALCKVA